MKDNSIENLLQKLYENDFVETQLERSQNKMAIYYDNLSKNDRSFLDLTNEKAKLVDGHYVLPLPFKDANIALPSNRFAAVKRLFSLKKRFEKDKLFLVEYQRFMKELIDKGHAKKCDKYALEG